MADRIRIRMYRVGFGDCFLITLPAAETCHHILIDCGAHSRGNAGTLAKVVADIETETGGALDLVVATHVHQDHLSGFATHGARFRRMNPKHVWMPWTDDESDPTAVRLSARTEALVRALTALKPGHLALMNLTGNKAALDLLRKQWPNAGAKIEFLEAGDARPSAAGIAGLKATILGPPRDEAFLRQMEPPPADHYFRAAAAKETGAKPKPLEPFLETFRWKPPKGKAPLTARFEKDFRESVLEDSEALAMKLDSVRNNTSLVILFPGDAEYGNWRAWVEKASAAAILSKVDFYKVSHHGSYNGTPKSVLEKMTNPALSAMLSTQSAPWPSIPRAGLIDRLKQKTSGELPRTDETSDLYLDHFISLED